MPTIQSLIGRPTTNRPVNELRCSDVEPDVREEAPHQRGDNDDVAPQRGPRPQFGEVKPMRYRAQPVPESLAGRCHLHRATRRAGYVELGPLVQPKMVEGPIGTEIFRYRPLVMVDGTERVRSRDGRSLDVGSSNLCGLFG